MARFRISITVKVFIGLLFVAAVFGVGTGLIYRSVEKLSAPVARIRQPNKVIDTWQSVTQHISIAGTLMRRYSLTGDTTFLERFSHQRDTINFLIASLRELADGVKERRDRADSLARYADARLEDLALTAYTADDGAATKDFDRTLHELATAEERKTTTTTVKPIDTLPKTATTEKRKSRIRRFFNNISGKKSSDPESDTAIAAAATAAMAVAEAASRADSLKAVMLVGKLTEARTAEQTARELELARELVRVNRSRAIDDKIHDLTAQMLHAEQMASAGLIQSATDSISGSGRYILVVLGSGAFVLIIFFTLLIRRDVRRGVRLQRQLHEARLRAEQLARTREEFAASMSHELRSPLNAIIGLSEQLDKSATPEQHQLTEALSRSSHHLLSLINPVLDLTRLSSGKVEFESGPFSLREVLRDVQLTFEQAASAKDITLISKAGTNLPDFVIGDEVRLRQILFNLVSNAIKFTDEGHITISCESAGETKNGRSRLEFTVSDTGIGIPPEKLGRIFDEFTQADSSITRRYGGTGLGLTITRKLIELQGGTIHVSSEEGVGSTFNFFIAYPKATVENSAPPELPGSKVRLDGKHILVCDDEEMNRMLAAHIIENSGGHVLEAGSGEEAIRLAKENKLDVILMDLQMPGISGIDTARNIRSAGIHVPIIAVTGNTNESDHIHEAGVNGYLVKPYLEHQLLQAIDEQLDAG